VPAATLKCVFPEIEMSHQDIGVQSIVINPSVCLCVCLSVCLYVCLSMSISLEPLYRSSRNFVCRSPLAMAWSSSGGVAICYVLNIFVDDVTFSRNGRDAKTWRLHRAAMAKSGVVIPGWSLMSINACRLLYHTLK